ncbi:magnesium transporter [Coprinopsis marcescibilis]|uniref:Magnesium transporter n=1 Tax=Coprinopsis marcescibilis TaxID=230819 RepID=A0A5C3KVM0_COPMA|nr:magnesium transporter [Coprinopsis marcescibilis]
MMGGRENSLSDSEGRSLTPDLAEEGIMSMSPTYGGVEPSYGTPNATNGQHHAHFHDLEQVISSRSKKSLRSHRSRAQSHKSFQHSPWANLPPKEKFKAAVRKVMAMRRGTALLGMVGGARPIGAEPGVDPTRPESDITYGHIHQECNIEIVDYSAIRHSSKKLTNEEFVDLMDNEMHWQAQPWVKVRWIRIGGLSWDVIKALASRYTLHPLALEDVFHGHSRNRSKADYYSKHLFIRVLCHELVKDADSGILPHFLRSASPDALNEGEEDAADSKGPPPEAKSRWSHRPRPILPVTNITNPRQGSDSSALAQLIKQEGQVKDSQKKQKAAHAFLETLKEGDRVHVKVTPLFMFLYRDGTVISINHDPDLEFSAPISARLLQRDTVLRKSVDPSLLVHALLDIAVDKALQVIDEYHAKIAKFERKILMKPNMNTVKALHILDGDLILHKRTLDPIKTMIFGLRRYDLDRVAALIDMSDPANKDVKVIGYMSHKAKIYLADVYDHMDYILTSLDMFSGIAENLIDYTFNVASYEMNEVMRQLTLATVIFLPLTFLTGYFGMNFTFMWSVVEQSDVLFWQIALPVMAVVIPLFLWRDISRGVHYMQKRLLKRKIKAE